MTAFHSRDIEAVLQELNTTHEGLSAKEVEKRLAKYGKNRLREQKVSKLKLFFRQFHNILIYTLLAASIVSLFVSDWKDFVVINAIIVINAFIGFWKEIKAESAIAALKKMTEVRCKVLRNDTLELVSSSALVPGDIVVLHEGEAVSADIRLIESSGLMIDESAITGESMPMVKDHKAELPEGSQPYELINMLLSGTMVVRGTGRGVVVKTGENTYLSSIAEKTGEEGPETPLTKAINRFALKYIVLLVILFTSLGVVGWLQGRDLLDIGYILLASLVSVVPEGLPIVITLVMVIGAIHLSKRKTLVRFLPSVETLGSTTVIASDKTGTITEGDLIVRDTFSRDDEMLRLVAALCNDSYEGSGDPIDVALYDWVEKAEELREEHPRKWGYSFDIQHRLMATINEINGNETLLVKGAYESLKSKAVNEDLSEIETKLGTFLDEGLRVLAFGVGEPKGENPDDWKIQVIGLIGFLDPPKEEVREAVASAKEAGVRVMMITGDHPKTAKAVAKETGIWSEGDTALTGTELAALSDAELTNQLKHTSVLARILPEHKYRIVKLLQDSKEIVAVTGDGVNDAPALKAAHLGIAMGSGTEAAKSVSAMIITDNNLKVIVEAIKNGRVIADNIRKVIYYLISTSMQEITVIALAIFSSLALPLTAIQILWINIVTDGFQDKTFPFAKAEGNVMQRKPKAPDKQFFDKKQVLRILYFGLSMGGFVFLLYVHLLPQLTYRHVTTIVFTSIVMAQLANGIQAQKETEPFFLNIKRSFTINPWIYAGLGFSVALQCAALYLIPHWLSSEPLSWTLWRYPLSTFGASFFLIEIRKWGETLYSYARRKQ